MSREQWRCVAVLDVPVIAHKTWAVFYNFEPETNAMDELKARYPYSEDHEHVKKGKIK